MRIPSTVFRGVLVCLTIMGVFLLTSVNSAQSSGTGHPQPLKVEAVELLADKSALTEERSTATLLNLPLINNQVVKVFEQGFDKCTPPSLNEMQTWWDYSPYSTFNIYLGGISLHCPHNLIIPDLPQLDQMGWRFILTWAGPQAPKGCPDNCKFKYPISLDPAVAYLEGIIEADAAVAAAISFGFKGPLVIYYDLESYSNIEAGDPARVAAAEFLRGWVEGLHFHGHVAGVYGSSCTSYISDWAVNDPPPDSVWIAYWNKVFEYDPYASVWNMPCLSNNLWAESQRLRQYTGGHYETWGEVQLRIDSDVILGPVNTLEEGIVTPQASILTSKGDLAQFRQRSTVESLQSMQLLSHEVGWVLKGERLLWTDDGGSSWRDISPKKSGLQSEILAAYFMDEQKGWLVQRVYDQNQPPSITVLKTSDSGIIWRESSLPMDTPEEVMQVESAVIDLHDEDHLWIVFKLHSSSNFSFGSLFATQDGGRTWQAGSLPLGEPVKFVDLQQGWVAGGPTGNQLFKTEDGGHTWRDQSHVLQLSNANGETSVGLPFITADGLLILPVASEDELLFYSTANDGESWSRQDFQQLGLSLEQIGQVPADLILDLQLLAGTSPDGLTALDLITDQQGWALVQNGSCSGYKSPTGSESLPDLPPYQCETDARLLRTTDGGHSWIDITPRD